MALDVFSLRERPDLIDLVFGAPFRPPFWPEFMLHDPAALLYFEPPFFDRYTEFAFAGVQDGEVVGRAFSLPFAFPTLDRPVLPDGGWDEVIRWAHYDQARGIVPTAASALEISLLPEVRGQGNARVMLEAMKGNARAQGLSSLYAPVRPSEKHRFPAMPIAEYVGMVRSDGLPQDAWLRTHVCAGGRIVGVAPYAMTIVGTVAEWRAWTNLPFERSGMIEVPGALSLVQVSVEQDYAVYVEPGVWFEHRDRQ